MQRLTCGHKTVFSFPVLHYKEAIFHTRKNSFVLQTLDTMTRRQKRMLFMFGDTAIIFLTLYGAFALRYGSFTPLEYAGGAWVLLPLITILGSALIFKLGLPHIKLTTFEQMALQKIAVAAVALSALTMVLSYILILPAPRSVPAMFGALFFLGSVGMRVSALQILNHLDTLANGKSVKVAIYGAGSGGIQMASALRQSSEARPVLFVDDNPNLHGLMIAGLPVYNPKELDNLITKLGVERVLMAMPSIAAERRKELARALSRLPVEVQILPSYVDMMVDGGLSSPLRTVSPDELLGREKVTLDTPEIERSYAGRNVMVTGAGGSIGSELCRQLLKCNPAKIVLFEQSEFALYEIDRDLRHLAMGLNIEITTRLGSVTNAPRISAMIAEESVDIILHAAAYKHVPIVENNELEGARNNVLGTQVVADCAMQAGIERMILISTDKAVRPTNIMGATKRMAELVIQDMQTRSTTTKFAMVRFGNVLGSSGSVLPLFQKQIAAGGPITVTHSDVTRFFMTIPEASRLVLLAGAYATGGDVFVLDMGKPQKIMDIAHKMVELSGRTVKDPETGIGDVAIEITGLRPGEKLYEELLIDNDSLVATPHAKILRAEESLLSEMEIVQMLGELQSSLEAGDPERLRKIVEANVDGYQRFGTGDKAHSLA